MKELKKQLMRGWKTKWMRKGKKRMTLWMKKMVGWENEKWVNEKRLHERMKITTGVVNEEKGRMREWKTTEWVN